MATASGAGQYCEPFAGSAAVLLNRNPSLIEVYNDIDGDVANFYRVLREHCDELECVIKLTLFSQEELHMAIHETPREYRTWSAPGASTSGPARPGPDWHKPLQPADGHTARTRKPAVRE